jgi:hypothetical protein
MPLSNAQFGGSDSYSSMADTPSIDTPLSLSKNTYGSAAQATAWKNRSLGSGGPMSLSSKTAGTTFNWDDSAASPSVPQSDKGMGRNA